MLLCLFVYLSLCVFLSVYLHVELQSKENNISPIVLYFSFILQNQSKLYLWITTYVPSMAISIHNSKPLC